MVKGSSQTANTLKASGDTYLRGRYQLSLPISTRIENSGVGLIFVSGRYRGAGYEAVRSVLKRAFELSCTNLASTHFTPDLLA